MLSSMQRPKFKSRRVSSFRDFPEGFELIPKPKPDNIKDIFHFSKDDVFTPYSKFPRALAAAVEVKDEESFTNDNNLVGSSLMPCCPKPLPKIRRVSADRDFPRFCGRGFMGEENGDMGMADIFYSISEIIEMFSSEKKRKNLLQAIVRSNKKLYCPQGKQHSEIIDKCSSKEKKKMDCPKEKHSLSSRKSDMAASDFLQHLQDESGEQRVNTAAEVLTAHIVTVYTGEDVGGKILSFALKGTRGVCVLSANGSVSNATIRQPAYPGGILTYEGRFEILKLTGSYMVSDNGGMKIRTGGLSVSLLGPDGRVIGGGVAGVLLAASPIQIVVGSFMTNSDKVQQQQRKQTPEPRLTPHVQQIPTNSVLLSTPPHLMSMAKSAQQSSPEGNMFPTPASQLPPQTRVETDHSRSNNNPSSLSTESAHCIGSERSAKQWPTLDINVSAPMEQQ